MHLCSRLSQKHMKLSLSANFANKKYLKSKIWHYTVFQIVIQPVMWWISVPASHMVIPCLWHILTPHSPSLLSLPFQFLYLVIQYKASPLVTCPLLPSLLTFAAQMHSEICVIYSGFFFGGALFHSALFPSFIFLSKSEGKISLLQNTA